MKVEWGRGLVRKGDGLQRSRALHRGLIAETVSVDSFEMMIHGSTEPGLIARAVTTRWSTDRRDPLIVGSNPIDPIYVTVRNVNEVCRRYGGIASSCIYI